MKAYDMEKFKEQSVEYQKLCAMLRKQADDGGLQLSDHEIRKGADRLMGYLEWAIKADIKNKQAKNDKKTRANRQRKNETHAA